MQITFYNISCSPNTVDKTPYITGGTAFTNVKPNEPCNILSPSLVMTYSSAVANSNYCYIDTFGRWYFVTGVTLVSATRCIVSCAVDVLHTYHANIKNCIGTVLRSESVGKPTMIGDSKLPVYTNERIVDCDNFPDTPFERNGLNPYILTTIGGSGSI